MFVCTFNEEQRERLMKQGFDIICTQHYGDKCLYTFDLKPALYELFSEEEKKEVFLSSKMVMA